MEVTQDLQSYFGPCYLQHLYISHCISISQLCSHFPYFANVPSVSIESCNISTDMVVMQFAKLSKLSIKNCWQHSPAKRVPKYLTQLTIEGMVDNNIKEFINSIPRIEKLSLIINNRHCSNIIFKKGNIYHLEIKHNELESLALAIKVQKEVFSSLKQVDVYTRVLLGNPPVYASIAEWFKECGKANQVKLKFFCEKFYREPMYRWSPFSSLLIPALKSVQFEVLQKERTRLVKKPEGAHQLESCYTTARFNFSKKLSDCVILVFLK